MYEKREKYKHINKSILKYSLCTFSFPLDFYFSDKNFTF